MPKMTQQKQDDRRDALIDCLTKEAKEMNSQKLRLTNEKQFLGE